MLFSKTFAGLALATLLHNALGQVTVTVTTTQQVTTTKQVTTTDTVCPNTASPSPTPLGPAVSQDGTCGAPGGYTCQGSTFGVSVNSIN